MGEMSVRGTASATLPLASQSAETTVDTKGAVAPNPTQTQSEQSEASPVKVEVYRQEAAQRKSEQSLTGSIKKSELNLVLYSNQAGPVNSNPTGASAALPKRATMTSKNFTSTEYDFGRPITKEQAAQVIFKEGKIPEGARLEQGPGPNAWTLRMSSYDEVRENILRKMRPRYETADPNKPYTAEVEWPDSPITEEATATKRTDQKNSFGFKVNKHYALDEGQKQVKHVTAGLGTGKGHGYEIEFEKPMTRRQVLDRIFDTSKLAQGAVKLIPVPREPASMWQIEIIGSEAVDAYKQGAMKPFVDASIHTPASIRPGVPEGIRKHMENLTIPKDAVKHPPNVYVWEQEGYLVRAEKGNGASTYEVTKLHPSDKKGNDTIRYFMKDLGMKPADAWKEYVKHWDDIHRSIVTAYALGMASGRMPRKVPAGTSGAAPRVVRNTQRPAPRVQQEPIPVRTNGTTLNTKAPTVNTKPPANVKQPVDPHAKTRVDPHAKTPVDPHAKTPNVNQQRVDPNATVESNPPARPAANKKPAPAQFPRAKRSLPDHQEITIKTESGPRKMTVGEYRRQYRLAEKWRTDQIMFHKRDPYDKQLDYDAAKKFGLDKGWQNIGNPYYP